MLRPPLPPVYKSSSYIISQEEVQDNVRTRHRNQRLPWASGALTRREPSTTTTRIRVRGDEGSVRLVGEGWSEGDSWCDNQYVTNTLWTPDQVRICVSRVSYLKSYLRGDYANQFIQTIPVPTSPPVKLQVHRATFIFIDVYSKHNVDTIYKSSAYKTRLSVLGSERPTSCYGYPNTHTGRLAIATVTSFVGRR